jgi:hypothetical protein
MTFCTKKYTIATIKATKFEINYNSYDIQEII